MTWDDRRITDDKADTLNFKTLEQRLDISGGAHTATFGILAKIIHCLARSSARFMQRDHMVFIFARLSMVMRFVQFLNGRRRCSAGRHRMSERRTSDNQSKCQQKYQNMSGYGLHKSTIHNVSRIRQYPALNVVIITTERMMPSVALFKAPAPER
jgi:hypothetical protein